MTKLYQQLMPISPDIPELENGDRLDSAEFLRRYENMPEGVHAELINGLVYMNAASVRYRQHGMPQNIVQYLLTHYAVHTPGVECSSPSTTIFDGENTYEPDVILRITEECGGQSCVGDKYLEGAPELVVEVAASSVRRDAHIKKDAYERLGVKEYILWKTQDKRIDWFASIDGRFTLLTPDSSGITRSTVFLGLWLNFELLNRMDGRASLSVLEKAFASEEHRQFTQSLQEYKT